MGMVWELHTDWDTRFQELVEFRDVYGHCNVPQKYLTNPSLGAWVAQQRRRYKSFTLSSERIAALEGLGMVWELRRGR